MPGATLVNVLRDFSHIFSVTLLYWEERKLHFKVSFYIFNNATFHGSTYFKLYILKTLF